MAAGIAMLVLAWMVTAGDWNFFPKAGFLENFYDGQAKSLLQGRIDVDPDAIGPEAFVREGKSYGYFGPTPALLRLPLQLVLPGMYGRWNCFSMLLACALTLCMLVFFMRKLQTVFPPVTPAAGILLRVVLIFATAIGSTTLFVSAERKVYQEAIIWGSALALTHCVLLVFYLMEPRGRWLALSCLAAFLAFFARLSSGSGPMVALLLVDLALLLPNRRLRECFSGTATPRRASLVISATLLLSVMAWSGLNYWKFGVWLVTQPVALNKQFSAERVQRVKGDIVSVYNLPITLPAYLNPTNIALGGSFPWAYFVGGDPSIASRYPKAHFDGYEPFSSVTAAMPGLLLAALAGSVLCFWRLGARFGPLRAPVAGALAGCSIIFVFGSITYRYLHDLLPWLAVGTAIALAWSASIPQKRTRYLLSALFVGLTLYAVWVNVAFALTWQRASSYPIPPERRLAFADLRYAVDQDGMGGLWDNLTRWRRYIPAASFQDGNLYVDKTVLAERGDWPVVRSRAQQPPFGANYSVQIPTEGTYELAVRYAAAQPTPIHLLINGHDVKQICNQPTGGWQPQFQAWSLAGLFQLMPGTLQIGLANDGPVPPISMLRLVRVR